MIGAFDDPSGSRQNCRSPSRPYHHTGQERRPARHQGSDDHGSSVGKQRQREHRRSEEEDDRKAKKAKPAVPDPDPIWETSGALAEDTNMFKGRQLKWTEPPDLKKPVEKYRLYVFKDGAPLDKEPYRLRNAAYMFGRDRGIVDIPMDHPSLSAQHAVLCYRLVQHKVPDANGITSSQRRLRPYIIDLESTNGTFVNGKKIPAARYYELGHKDVLRFGISTREYILLKESAAE